MNLLAVFIGTFAGIVIGALPGLSTVMGLSILLPFTLSFSGMGGMYMLLGVFCGGIYGGSISASLLNTPGTSASAATALDGYPMANKLGQPGRALGISTLASLFGGLFSAICLCIFAPLLAKVALKFSAQEYFALAVFGISIVAGLTGKSVIKGVIGGVIGLLLATIGIDGMGGVSRFTFGSVYLMGGISFIPLLIGLFAFSQGLNTIEEMAKGYKAEKNRMKIEHVFPSKSDLKRIFPTLIRSSIIGTFIGAVPGTGGDIASWVSYSQAKSWSKHKEEFGHGSPEGLAACESGNNAISGGAFVPLLSLGIPGDAGTAVMLGSLTMLGLAPGPLLFTEHKDSVYMLFVGLFVANLLMGLLGFAGIRLWSRVLDIPQKILLPLIFTFCFVGTYACNRSLNDVYMMIIAGIAGYVLQKMDFSLPPIILGVILGGMIEKNFRRALILSDGDVGTFFTRPISCVFIILAAVSLFSPVIKTVIASKKAKKQAAAAADGISLWILSSFRSYEDQDVIYNRYVAQDGRDAADTYSSRPGHSDHQTGYTFDLNSLEQDFQYDPAGKWLDKNCYKYGFIIRYPKGKESSTGYMYEPWHVRYIGVDLATKVTQSGLSLEEYFGITSQYQD